VENYDDVMDVMTQRMLGNQPEKPINPYPEASLAWNAWEIANRHAESARWNRDLAKASARKQQEATERAEAEQKSADQFFAAAAKLVSTISIEQVQQIVSALDCPSRTDDAKDYIRSLVKAGDIETACIEAASASTAYFRREEIDKSR